MQLVYAFFFRHFNRLVHTDHGFFVRRFAEFEKLQVPVDAYGVGSYLMRGVNAFTADVVLLHGKPCAKVGREYKANPRLEAVNSG